MNIQEYRIKPSMSKDLKALIRQLRALKPIDPKLGEWYSYKEYKPICEGRYLVILQSKSPNEHNQSWAGMGCPEIASYNENYDTSPLSNWNSRGSLSVAYFSKLTEFNMVWEKNIFGECGKFIKIES
jgi:hypothetical protein